MRQWMLAGLLCASGLLAAVPSRAEMWCLPQPGSQSHGQQSQVCAFSSARDCTMAATFGAFGGTCECAALGPRPKADKRRTDRKSARERRDQRWW